MSEHAAARPLNLLPPYFENQTLSGSYKKSVLFEMTDKSLRVKLVIVSLLEHNLNQQTSLFNFRSFNSTRKVLTKFLVYIRLKSDTALPNIMKLGYVYHCNFAEILFAFMCLGKTYMMPFFCKLPSPGLNKQS